MLRQRTHSGSGSVSPLLLFFLACTLLACGVVSSVVQASSESANNLVFILDASGSMAAPVQGKAKIVVAKEVLSDLIKDLPAGVNIGLVVYGHREKKDCMDVEELAPMGQPNKEALINGIKSIQPKGMTPITYSVQKVAEGLKAVEGETTIVLVSDGEETCGGDPCALVKELKASGVKFVMHVIGFDVGEKEKAQLVCLAQAGGGSYFTAKNAGEFSLAARKVVEKTEQSSGKLKVKALRNGKPFSAFCRVFKAGENEDGEKQPLAAEWTQEEGVAIKLLPGAYDMIVENQEDAGHPTLSFQAITIEAGKSIEKVADFSGGTLKVKALRNGKPFSAFCKVFKVGESEEEEKQPIAAEWTQEEGVAIKLLPGVYDVIVENQEDAGHPTLSFQAIAVEAGKSIEKVVDFSGGTLKVKALRNGKPFSAFCKVFKSGEKEDEEKQPIAAEWIREEGVAIKLLPGVYDMIVENQEDATHPILSFQAIAIEAGKSIEKVAEFSGGTLKVKALRNGKPFSAFCKVFTAGESEEEEKQPIAAEWTREEGLAIKLLPGVYDMIVENQEDATHPILSFQAIAIETGKSIEKVAEFSGGTLKVKALRNGKPFSAFCKVFPAGEKEDEEKQPLAAEWTREEGLAIKLLPGVYDVIVENQDSHENKEFKGVTIEAAKTQAVEAQF